MGSARKKLHACINKMMLSTLSTEPYNPLYILSFYKTSTYKIDASVFVLPFVTLSLQPPSARLTLQSLNGVFTVLAMGLCLSVFALLGEYCFVVYRDVNGETVGLPHDEVSDFKNKIIIHQFLFYSNSFFSF